MIQNYTLIINIRNIALLTTHSVYIASIQKTTIVKYFLFKITFLFFSMLEHTFFNVCMTSLTAIFRRTIQESGY